MTRFAVHYSLVKRTYYKIICKTPQSNLPTIRMVWLAAAAGLRRGNLLMAWAGSARGDGDGR